VSKHGRQRKGKVPGIRMNPGNGDTPFEVPPDLEWPCTVYSCTYTTEHAPDCDGNCEANELSEINVKLENLRREYFRNQMSFVGLPEGVPSPIPGINVNLIDLLCRIITIEEMVFELVGIDREEYDQKFIQTKFDFLNEILQANKERVRRQRTANALGIVEKPGLLGPDGQPLG
jgi:hypothetical protein